MNLVKKLVLRLAIGEYLPGIVVIKGRQLVGSNIIAFCCADPRVRFLAVISRMFRRNNVSSDFKAGPVGRILNDTTRALLLEDSASTIEAMREHFAASTVVIGAHDDCKADRWPAEEHVDNLVKACQIMTSEPMLAGMRVVGIFLYEPDSTRQISRTVFDSRKKICKKLVIDADRRYRFLDREDHFPF